MDIPVDHFSSNNYQTFKKYYWFNDTYYQPGGPVLVIDNGEFSAQPFAGFWLQESVDHTAVMALARRFNGLAILFEHRYYGRSLPVSMDLKTNMPEEGILGYRFLTFELAMEDAVYFANNFKPPGLEEHWKALCPTKSPWIWIGESYTGIRAAILRVRNPETFFASWASSAPVLAMEDQSSYFRPIKRAMAPNCSADTAAAIGYFDDILSNGTEAAITQLKRAVWSARNVTDLQSVASINNTKADATSYYDLAWLLTTPYNDFQEHGASSLRQYCDTLESFNGSISSRLTPSNLSSIFSNSANATPLDEGIAATYGPATALHAFLYALASLSTVASAAFSNSTNGTNNTNNTTNSTTTFNGSQFPIDAKSWTYQSCTEFGFFQTFDTKSSHNIVSRFLNLTSYHESYCLATFDLSASNPESGLIPQNPDVAKINKYGGWTMQPSNVLFTDGEVDPWRGLSVHSDEPDSPRRKSTEVIPRCNQPPRKGEVFGIVYKEGVHAGDLVGDSRDPGSVDGRSFERGVRLFGRALDEWLPCFYESVGNRSVMAEESSKGRG
jgi:Serine carboxypeptidase S28